MGNKPAHHQLVADQENGSVESITPREDVESLPYFYKDISRDQAEAILSRYANEPGRFLLRLGSRHRRYAITIVVSGGRVGHAEVFVPEEGSFYVDENLKFETLSQLVQHYSEVTLPNVTRHKIAPKLQYPVYKFRKLPPKPYQREPIAYGALGEISFYNTAEDHIPQRRRMPATRNCEFRRFRDENDRPVTLFPPPIPPRIGRDRIFSEDTTTPKQPVQERAPEQQNHYVRPDNFNEPVRPDPFSTAAYDAIRGHQSLYVPMNGTNTSHFA